MDADQYDIVLLMTSGVACATRSTRRKHDETVRDVVVSVEYFDEVDARVTRAAAAHCDHRIDLMQIAGERGLDTAVPPIAHPPVKTARTRFSFNERSISDALNQPLDTQKNAAPQGFLC